MQKIFLYTRGGDPVTEIEIPVFHPPADVVLWGSRCFVWNELMQQYREGLMWTTPIIAAAGA